MPLEINDYIIQYLSSGNIQKLRKGTHKDYSQFTYSYTNKKSSVLDVEIQFAKFNQLFEMIKEDPSNFLITTRQKGANYNVIQNFARSLNIPLKSLKPGGLSTEDILQQNIIVIDHQDPIIKDILRYSYYNLIPFYHGGGAIPVEFVIPFKNYPKNDFARVLNLYTYLFPLNEVPPGFDPSSLASKAEGITSTSQDH